ncbi:MAG TPA: response regulator, partial [Opitutaceae bacterium]|nr:response regulator [Opitutaceae bacterium]
MTRLRALIVDDEPLARERLRALLRDEPSVEIVGECGSGTDAIATLRSTPIDLVLLDVEMPG